MFLNNCTNAFLIFVIFVNTFLQISNCENWDLVFEAKGDNFFDNFTFFTEKDPSHGYVNYVNRTIAYDRGFIQTLPNDNVYIGCDHTNIGTAFLFVKKFVLFSCIDQSDHYFFVQIKTYCSFSSTLNIVRLKWNYFIL